MVRAWDEAGGAVRGGWDRSGPGGGDAGRSADDPGYKGHLRALFDGLASKAGPDDDWHGAVAGRPGGAGR